LKEWAVNLGGDPCLVATACLARTCAQVHSQLCRLGLCTLRTATSDPTAAPQGSRAGNDKAEDGIAASAAEVPGEGADTRKAAPKVSWRQQVSMKELWSAPRRRKRQAKASNDGSGAAAAAGCDIVQAAGSLTA
jgi:hypothetical protein